MTRFDCDYDEGIPWERWEQIVSNALGGRKGQAALAEMTDFDNIQGTNDIVIRKTSATRLPFPPYHIGTPLELDWVPGWSSVRSTIAHMASTSGFRCARCTTTCCTGR